MTHETLMSKNVKIFQGPTDRRTDRPTDMTSPRSSSPELKKHTGLQPNYEKMSAMYKREIQYYF